MKFAFIRLDYEKFHSPRLDAAFRPRPFDISKLTEYILHLA